jgi:DNA-binding beta-propeller fold protein YncE
VTALYDRPTVGDAPPAVSDLLVEEARRRHRSRRRRIATSALLLVVIGATIAVTLLTSGPGPSGVATGVRIARPLPATLANRGATTAFVSDAGGLVPIDLSTDALQPAIGISGFDGTTNVVGSPNGRTAYVVTLPIATVPGVDEAGPALVPVDLVTRRAGRPIPFRASAFRSGAGLYQTVSFDLTGLAITPNGKTVLVADAADHAVIPIDVATRTVERPIVLPLERTVGSLIRGSTPISNYAPVQPADLGDIAIDPTGRMAYIVDGYVVIPINLITHRPLAPISGFEVPSQIAVDPSGQYAYVTSAYCWSSDKTGACVPSPRHPVTEPNGQIQLYAGGDQVTVVDLRTDQIVEQIPVGKSAMPTGIAVSPTGVKVYVTYGIFGGHGNDVTVIDARTNAIERQLRDGLPATRSDGATYLSVTPRGQRAFVTGFTVITPGPGSRPTFRGAVVIDLSTGEPTAAVGFGTPVKYGQSTGPVVFGR